MSIGHTSPVGEVAAGTAFELLAELAAASRAPRDDVPDDLRSALDAVGDTAGEAWLNLLGVPLDAGPPFTAARLVDALRALDPVELRRVLLGRYAWSWCTLAGSDDIEAAAGGDEDAARRLLAHPRYYAGRARESLGTLLRLDPAETQRRLVAAVEEAAAQLAPSAAEAIGAARDVASALVASEPLLRAIERLTDGYRYVPELEAERVMLIPHVERRLPLVLAQHRGARLVVYRVTPERDTEERLLALGRALADPKRIEILALVGRGVGRSSEIVGATGLTRSTVHHHLALLRDAGLVALEGNARAYTYVPRSASAREAAALLGDLVGTEEQ
jgi:DNA-binding transcriptional ArsR family regulator